MQSDCFVIFEQAVGVPVHAVVDHWHSEKALALLQSLAVVMDEQGVGVPVQDVVDQ